METDLAKRFPLQYELIAKLRAEIAREEDAFCVLRDEWDARGYDPALIREAFDRLRKTTYPMRLEADRMTQAIVDVLALEAPPQIFITAPSSHPTS